MTPTEILTAARDLYNATGDTFFSDTQMYVWLTQASSVLARKSFCIERTYTTTTTASTRTYSWPTYALAIKRATIDGKKISPVTFRDDDALTLSNASITSTGIPMYYVDYNRTLYLRPTPDSSSYAFVLYTYNDAQAITAASTLEIPNLYHFDTVDFLLARMFGKDKDFGSAAYHMGLWNDHVKGAIAHEKKRRRADSFATVQSEDTLPCNLIGAQ